MSSVTIVCPNARRQAVKVQPNTKVLDIIEEVCRKQGFFSDEYGLFYHKKFIDVTLPYRLTGIANNAEIELKLLPGGARKFSDVVISLQLDDGSRLEPLTFNPQMNLHHVIETFKETNKSKFELKYDDFSTCSYLNDQRYGRFQLENTTLKDFGLTNGRGILRLGNKPTPKDVFEKSDLEFRQLLDKQAKLDATFQQKQIKRTEATQSQPQISTPTPKEEYIVIDNDNVTSKEKKIRPNPTNLEQTKNPTETKGPIKDDMIPIQRNEFSNFKFPEETKGKKLNDINELAVIEKTSREACERHTILFRSDKNETTATTAATATTSDALSSDVDIVDITDDFFDVTVSDLRYMLSDLKKDTNQDAPLMTAKLRELDQDKKAMKYTKVVMRVLFKNGLCLQGLFRPKEPLSSLYQFVRDNLSIGDNSQDDLDFYLFTAPPKNVLSEMKKNLFELQLCPASFVHYSNKSGNIPNLKSTLTCETVQRANDIVEREVYQGVREVKHEGMDSLYKEELLAQNLLKQSGLLNSMARSNQNQNLSSSNRNTNTTNDDPIKSKLEKFLKGSKK
jgi:tether containing UBX domain for GLUT4